MGKDIPYHFSPNGGQRIHTEYGALDRKDCFYNLAKEKLVQSAFVSYILVKALPQFFEKHLHTLKRKKMTLTTQDEYGVWNFDKWFKELDYFYENVVQDDIYHWIDNNTDRLNTLWLVHPHNSNAWGILFISSSIYQNNLINVLHLTLCGKYTKFQNQNYRSTTIY